MKNIDKKLGCKHQFWVKFGGRRRKCKICGQTWRKYKHKRGRDRKYHIQIFKKYINGELPSLVHYAKKKKISVRSLSYILEKQRDIFVKKTSWPKIPDGPIILIADAFINQIQHEWYTTYIILIRGVNEDKAVVFPPYIVPGREGLVNWYKALNKIPIEVHRRIKALISDGHRGTVIYTKNSGWILQRCTFHLISSMQGRRSMRKYGLHIEEGKKIYELTRLILEEENPNKLFRRLSELEDLGWQTKSKKLKTIISGFIRNIDDYRAWIKYKDLNLPNTSNSAESMIGIFKRFHARSHGFRSIKSLTQWVIAILKYRKEIFCRPKKKNKHQPIKLL
jgi:hypothetical protein